MMPGHLPGAAITQANAFGSKMSAENARSLALSEFMTSVGGIAGRGGN
jgi:hypothetical protein